uniref:Uncharacterized protein n=1 Tax=Cacopsylla melanoneura TaxID=428564 RepID=A0A8D8WDG3_9HEMI
MSKLLVRVVCRDVFRSPQRTLQEKPDSRKQLHNFHFPNSHLRDVFSLNFSNFPRLGSVSFGNMNKMEQMLMSKSKEYKQLLISKSKEYKHLLMSKSMWYEQILISISCDSTSREEYLLNLVIVKL